MSNNTVLSIWGKTYGRIIISNISYTWILPIIANYNQVLIKITFITYCHIVYEEAAPQMAT